MKIELTATQQIEDRALPVLLGAGEATVDNGRLVLSGTVYRLSSWWMNGFVMALAFAALVPWFLLCKELGFDEAGIWTGLGAIAAACAVDWWQQRRGRAYRIAIPPDAGYQITRVYPTSASGDPTPSVFTDHRIPDARVEVVLQLDSFVVGDFRRPPIIAFSADGKHTEAIQDALRS